MALFENFPYTNIHELNLDWIVKIAKDFLEQYTTIQETITNGLTALDDKAANLEVLLQAWYDTHSEDIANQLADALADLNAWYDEHQGYLDQYVTDSIAEFEQTAQQKAAETIATIPADYTALSNDVLTLKSGTAGISLNLLAYQGGALSGDVSLDNMYTTTVANRIRTFYNIPEIYAHRVPANTILKISSPAAYKYILGAYDVTTRAMILQTYDYKTGDNVYVIPSESYIALIIGKQDESNITPNEITNVSIEILSGVTELDARLNEQAMALNALVKKIAFAYTLTNEYHEFLNSFDLNYANDNTIKANAYINTSTSPAAYQGSSLENFSAVLQIDPSKTYKIYKKYSAVFRIATYENFPQTGSAVLSTQANHSGTDIVFTSEANAHWLQIMYYETTLSAQYNEAEIYNSIEVTEE